MKKVKLWSPQCWICDDVDLTENVRSYPLTKCYNCNNPKFQKYEMIYV